MRGIAIRFGALAAGLAALLTGGGAEAQAYGDGTRASLYLALGGGGETEYEADPSSALFDGSVDNEATVGLGGRIETPLGDYLALGLDVTMLSYEVDGADRDLSGHFDLWAKGRFMLDLGIGPDLEVYVGVPVGFSVVSVERNTSLDREERSLGWNIGALVGGQLFLSETFGAFLELGWRRVQVYNRVPSFDLDLTSRTNQFAFNVGGTMVF